MSEGFRVRARRTSKHRTAAGTQKTGQGWSCEVTDVHVGAHVGPRALRCPEGSAKEDKAAQLGLGSQANPGSWLPGLLPCQVAEEVLEGSAEWALVPQHPVWCAVKLSLPQVASCFNSITGP